MAIGSEIAIVSNIGPLEIITDTLFWCGFQIDRTYNYIAVSIQGDLPNLKSRNYWDTKFMVLYIFF